MPISFKVAVLATVLALSSSPAYSQLDFTPVSPDSHGVDSGPITALANALANGTFSQVHSLLVVRHGKVLHESYYSGNTDYFDDNLNRVSPGDTLWDASMPHYVASVAKSMTSAVVGIALAEHAVSVDSTVRELIPTYRNLFFGYRETGIQVRHLLTMTGGHAWDEWGSNDLSRMWRSGQDFIQFALSPAMAHDPGTFWRYNSGETNVLMGVVDALSGNASSYIQERLFDPLEITSYDWQTQPGGLPEAAARLFMRPRDLAKVAELYLNRGLWGDLQVIPKAWVDSSLAVQVSTAPLTEWDYGYLWWAKTINYTRDGIAQTQRYYAAEGDGGNLIAVFPNLDLAVIVTQGNYSDFGTYDRQNYAILANYILPATSAIATDTETGPPEVARRTELSLDVYPNPASNSANIEFFLPSPGRVIIQVFDSLGKRVAHLTDVDMPRGVHYLGIGEMDVPAGAYFVRLTHASGSGGSQTTVTPLVRR